VAVEGKDKRMRLSQRDRKLTSAVLYPASVLPSGMSSIGDWVAGKPGRWVGYGLGGLLGLPVLACCALVLLLVWLMECV
jgi:hypothetical protein